MDDDLILAVGSRGRGKGEFTNPQVLMMIMVTSMVIVAVKMMISTTSRVLLFSIMEGSLCAILTTSVSR